MQSPTLDLFGREIFEPIPGDTLPLFHEPVRLDPPARSGVDARIAQQYQEDATPMFDEAAIPDADEPVAVPKRRHIPPAGLPARLIPRRSLIQEVERDLRLSGTPYVAVDDAKKALFANAKLKSFHFVAYSKDGPNLLLWCGRPTQATRDDMAEWEKVFGEGFAVCYAIRAGGRIKYQLTNGTEYPLTAPAGAGMKS